MDPETQAHIEAQRRPPERHEPRRADGQVAKPPEPELTLPEREAALAREVEDGTGEVVEALPPQPDKATMIPASRYVLERQQRERDRVVATMDRIAPVTSRKVEDGTVWTIKARCSGCKAEVLLHCDDFTELEAEGEELGIAGEPGLRARMVAVGWLRTAPVEEDGCFSGVMCDGCQKRVEAREIERKAASERGSRLGDACLPKALQGFRFEEMRPHGYHENDRKLAIDASRQWASVERVQGRPGLLLFGTRGAGKTRLAATAAYQRLRRWPVRWVSWPALVGQLLGAFDDDDRKVAMSVLNGTGALILDDIARDDLKVSDWAKEKLFVAIDKRVQAGTPILMTTNLTGTQREPENPLAALGERLGASIASRLAGYCRVVEVPGDDMRLVFDFDGRQRASAAEEEAATEGLQDSEVEE